MLEVQCPLCNLRVLQSSDQIGTTIECHRAQLPQRATKPTLQPPLIGEIKRICHRNSKLSGKGIASILHLGIGLQHLIATHTALDATLQQIDLRNPAQCETEAVGNDHLAYLLIGVYGKVVEHPLFCDIDIEQRRFGTQRAQIVVEQGFAQRLLTPCQVDSCTASSKGEILAQLDRDTLTHLHRAIVVVGIFDR